MLFSRWILLLTTTFLSSSEANKTERTEKVLPADILKDLTKGYDKGIRPPNYGENGENKPVEVEVNAYLRSMSNIDFVKMEYSVQLTFRQSWLDSRLAYGASWEGKKVPKYMIVTRGDLLWIPDTFFMNEKQAHRHMIDTPNMLFRVHPDGRVLYSERISLVLSCPMFLQRFPMDRQECQILFASYAFTTDDIIYKWKESSPIQFHPLLGGSLPCFTINRYDITNCSSSTNTGDYSCLGVTFHLHRQFSYYLVQIYVPSTLLVIVSWVSFWLERTAVPARVTLGVTTLLTITTQAAALNSSLPAVSYVKAVDVWMGGCLAFIFSAVFEYAYVSLVASTLETNRKMTKCESHQTTAENSPNDAKKEWNAEEERNLLSLKQNKAMSRSWCSWWYKWTFEADLNESVYIVIVQSITEDDKAYTSEG